MRTVDDYGRVCYDVDDLFRLKLEGRDTDILFAAESSEAIEFNRLCTVWDKPQMRLVFPPRIDHTPAEEHARRQQEWSVPDPYMEMDIVEYVLALCQDEAEVERCREELTLFDAHRLLPVLKACVYLVEYFRSHKIVHGVGRGSSVASYVLFKIGLHRIDSIKYRLDIHDFLKDT